MIILPIDELIYFSRWLLHQQPDLVQVWTALVAGFAPMAIRNCRNWFHDVL
jgi:hypothetical protein